MHLNKHRKTKNIIPKIDIRYDGQIAAATIMYAKHCLALLFLQNSTIRFILNELERNNEKKKTKSKQMTRNVGWLFDFGDNF